MKHKFQLTGAVALALMTGGLALFAQVPSVITSAMKTRTSLPTDRSLSKCSVTERGTAVR